MGCGHTPCEPIHVREPISTGAICKSVFLMHPVRIFTEEFSRLKTLAYSATATFGENDEDVNQIGCASGRIQLVQVCNANWKINPTARIHNFTWNFKAMYRSQSSACESNVTSIIKELCEKREECDVPHDNDVLGDPCRGEQKMVVVTWQCA